MDDVVTPVAAVDLGVDRQKLGLGRQQLHHAAGDEAVAKIRHHHGIKILQMSLQPVAELVFHRAAHRVFLEEIHLEQLGQVGIDKAALGDRGRIGEGEEMGFDIGQQLVADKGFMAVQCAQAGHQGHITRKAGHVVGNGQGAAGKLFF